jgi:hypothetical protein
VFAEKQEFGRVVSHAAKMHIQRRLFILRADSKWLMKVDES